MFSQPQLSWFSVPTTFLHSSESFIKIYSVLFIELSILQSYQIQELVRALVFVRTPPLYIQEEIYFITFQYNSSEHVLPAKMSILGVKTGYEEEHNPVGTLMFPFFFTVAHSKCSI